MKIKKLSQFVDWVKSIIEEYPIIENQVKDVIDSYSIDMTDNNVNINFSDAVADIEKLINELPENFNESKTFDSYLNQLTIKNKMKHYASGSNGSKFQKVIVSEEFKNKFEIWTPKGKATYYVNKRQKEVIKGTVDSVIKKIKELADFYGIVKIAKNDYNEQITGNKNYIIDELSDYKNNEFVEVTVFKSNQVFENVNNIVEILSYEDFLEEFQMPEAKMVDQLMVLPLWFNDGGSLTVDLDTHVVTTHDGDTEISNREDIELLLSNLYFDDIQDLSEDKSNNIEQRIADYIFSISGDIVLPTKDEIKRFLIRYGIIKSPEIIEMENYIANISEENVGGPPSDGGYATPGSVEGTGTSAMSYLVPSGNILPVGKKIRHKDNGEVLKFLKSTVSKQDFKTPIIKFQKGDGKVVTLNESQLKDYVKFNELDEKFDVTKVKVVKPAITTSINGKEILLNIGDNIEVYQPYNSIKDLMILSKNNELFNVNKSGLEGKYKFLEPSN